jgi:hypothetical protein
VTYFASQTEIVTNALNTPNALGELTIERPPQAERFGWLSRDSPCCEEQKAGYARVDM